MGHNSLLTLRCIVGAMLPQNQHILTLGELGLMWSPASMSPLFGDQRLSPCCKPAAHPELSAEPAN